jgi:TatD DNase family protein
MITDSHAHIFWKSFDEDRAEMLARAAAAGVSRMVIVGTDLETSRAAIELCRSETNLFPSAGIHPHDAAEATNEVRAEIEAMCRLPECVAVGETGLDYFKEYSPKNDQFENFHWHLDLARRLDKPIIVHCRDAHEDTARLIAEYPGVRGVMHCYTFSEVELPPYLEAGFYISFSGVVTYPANEPNRRAAAAVPSERLLVETDCPFLSPQGKRGKRNEPANAADVLRRISEIRNADFEELAKQTSDNATQLFSLPK